MRKPRDYDAELKALDDKARRLKDRKLAQLGELVIATNADTLPIEMLAGALLAAKASDAKTKEEWRRQGAAFFQRKRRDAASSSVEVQRDAAPRPGHPKPAAGEPGLL